MKWFFSRWNHPEYKTWMKAFDLVLTVLVVGAIITVFNHAGACN
jgi:hypothetical protein